MAPLQHAPAFANDLLAAGGVNNTYAALSRYFVALPQVVPELEVINLSGHPAGHPDLQKALLLPGSVEVIFYRS